MLLQQMLILEESAILTFDSCSCAVYPALWKELHLQIAYNTLHSNVLKKTNLFFFQM